MGLNIFLLNVFSSFSFGEPRIRAAGKFLNRYKCGDCAEIAVHGSLKLLQVKISGKHSPGLFIPEKTALLIQGIFKRFKG